MSCQQAVKPILANTAIPTRNCERCYVLERLPTNTPPPVIENKQKYGAKLPKLIASTSISVSTSARKLKQKLPLAQINGIVRKGPAVVGEAVITLAAPEQSSTIAVVGTTAIAPAVVGTKRVKNAPQLPKLQAKRRTIYAVAGGGNVGRTQPDAVHHHRESPLPTPSLWQTPLLLDAVVQPLTTTSHSTQPQTSPIPGASAPLVSMASSTLPPSKFHHTTFAQHLQRVGCLKRSSLHSAQKWSPNVNAIDRRSPIVVDASNVEVERLPTEKKSSSSSSPSPAGSTQHSYNDLNRIPVNVIYRKPSAAGEIGANTPLESNGIADTNHQETVASIVHSPWTDNGNQCPLAKVTPALPSSSIASNCLSSSISAQDLVPLHDATTDISQVATSTSAPATASSSSSSIVKQKVCGVSSLSEEDVTAQRCLPVDGDDHRRSPTSDVQKQKAFRVRKHALSLQAMKAGGGRRPDSACLESRTKAFAVVSCPESSHRSASDVVDPPYCMQRHWLDGPDPRRDNRGLPTVMGREDRIEQQRDLLRRQATQLLATRKLLGSPMRTARRRLVCVDRLLRKYQNHNTNDESTEKICEVPICTNPSLPMATHCYEHICYSVDQKLFLSCAAKFADNTQCRVPVFDVMNEVPLCSEHTRKRDAYNRIWQEQRPRKPSVVSVAAEKNSQQELPPTMTMPICVNVSNAKGGRNKRKLNSSIKPMGRPQKRVKKASVTPALVPLSPIKQRKSSNTSLESLGSNTHHGSHGLHVPPFLSSTANNVVLAPPALAPLSGGRPRYHQYEVVGGNGNDNVATGGTVASSAAVAVAAATATAVSSRGGAAMPLDGLNRLLNFGSSTETERHELNQIVAQFGMAANDNNSNSHTDFSSGFSSLPSADEILTQDMLSICENSSIYASSEDTGVGGLSETELMVDPHDVEEIPLGDTHLLEEQDLTNVLNALPVDAFNELFTAVRQDERDEVERALELADKHLKSLQQRMGNETEFLEDFLDTDERITSDISNKMAMMSSSVLHSPDTSGIDTATLFVEGASNSGDGAMADCASTVADIRGLVQT